MREVFLSLTYKNTPKGIDIFSNNRVKIYSFQKNEKSYVYSKPKLTSHYIYKSSDNILIYEYSYYYYDKNKYIRFKDYKLDEFGYESSNFFGIDCYDYLANYEYNNNMISVDVNKSNIKNILTDVVPYIKPKSIYSYIDNNYKIYKINNKKDSLVFEDDKIIEVYNYKNGLPHYIITKNRNIDTIKFEYEYYED